MSTTNKPNSPFLKAIPIFLSLFISFFYDFAVYKDLGSLGFPIDDPWIHMSFGRNISQGKGFSFNPGELSAGSTAPLWTLIIALLHLFKPNPLILIHFLGVFILLAVILLLMKIANDLFPEDKKTPIIAGCLTALTWQMHWSALSGMETLSFTLLVLWGFYLYLKKANPILTGIIMGAGGLIRPEAILLPFILIFFEILSIIQIKSEGNNFKKAIKTIFIWGVIYLLFNSPFWYFNYTISGRLFPNTFYAKIGTFKGEQLAFLNAILIDFLPLSLIPFFVLAVFKFRKPINRTLPLFWMMAHTMAYLILLPGKYHYLRYLFPILPFFCLYSAYGMQALRISKLTLFLKILVFLAMLFQIYSGKLTFKANVVEMKSFQHKMALFIKENIKEEAKIAADDVGILRYFGGHYVLDLRGLIHPQVLTLLKEKSLEEVVKRYKVDYLVIYPQFYKKYLPLEILKPVLEMRIENRTVSASDNLVLYQVIK